MTVIDHSVMLICDKATESGFMFFHSQSVFSATKDVVISHKL